MCMPMHYLLSRAFMYWRRRGTNSIGTAGCLDECGRACDNRRNSSFSAYWREHMSPNISDFGLGRRAGMRNVGRRVVAPGD